MDIYTEQKNGFLKHSISGGVFNPDYLKEEIEQGLIEVIPYEESEEEKQLKITAQEITEREWRNEQLDPLRYEIDILEDQGKDATALRSYRQELKDYPLKTGFPFCERPIHP
jgi:hypothetical protein